MRLKIRNLKRLIENLLLEEESQANLDNFIKLFEEESKKISDELKVQYESAIDSQTELETMRYTTAAIRTFSNILKYRYKLFNDSKYSSLVKSEIEKGNEKFTNGYGRELESLSQELKDIVTGEKETLEIMSKIIYQTISGEEVSDEARHRRAVMKGVQDICNPIINNIDPTMSEQEGNNIDEAIQTLREIIVNFVEVLKGSDSGEDELPTYFILDSDGVAEANTIGMADGRDTITVDGVAVISNSPPNPARQLPGREPRPHKGADFRARTPQNIYAVTDGALRHKGSRTSSGGLIIQLEGDDGNIYRYLHLSDRVPESDDIKGGEYIGKTGDTGQYITQEEETLPDGSVRMVDVVNTYPAHLHFEIIFAGQSSGTTDMSHFKAFFEKSDTKFPTKKSLAGVAKAD